MPERVDRRDLPIASNWAGVAVTVVDARPRPAKEPVTRWIESGLNWDGYSQALVQETRRNLLEALGPASPAVNLELSVSIREHIVRFDAPNWVGTTALDAMILKAGAPTTMKLAARGQDVRWNWLGIETARASAQAGYEAAVGDLLRQLALTRPAPAP